MILNFRGNDFNIIKLKIYFTGIALREYFPKNRVINVIILKLTLLPI